ncbi:MAG TPA: AMP-binding protein [Actinomycetota bacterium]|nr:AMP-binding protein [Actinomycetota bacterium]
MGARFDPVGAARRLRSAADPRTGLALARTGAVTPRRAVAAWCTAPWLVGRGASLGILSQINALSAPNRPAVIDGLGTVTWREVDERSSRLARALRELGAGPDDTVATLVRNGREAVEAVFAAQKLGVTVAPLNTWGREPELAALLDRLRPRVLIADPRHAEPIAASIPRSTALVTVGEGYEQLIASQPPAPLFPLAIPRRHGRIVIHTSGTTGTPKAAARSARSSGPLAIAGLLATVPLRRSDVVYLPAPLFHSFGLLTLSLGSALGATFVLPDRFDAEESLALMVEHRATVAAFVPVMLRRILDLPRSRRKPRPAALRAVLASGSSISPDMRREVKRFFGDVLYDLYGSTEGGWVAVATPSDMAADVRTAGRPVRGVEVAVFDEEGGRLPPGGHGVLHVRSDALFEGYQSGESTAERDGFLSMGDMGWLEADGRLFVEGRADDMVVVGGENVDPAEVEQAISRVRGVDDVAVVGVPDRQYGHVLAAFVVGSASPQAIEAAAKRDLASFKVPRTIEVVDELPRTSTGKILRRELGERLERSSA